MAQQYDSYFAATIVVPNDGARHQLHALMLAIEPIAPIRSRYLDVQVDALSADSLLVGSGPFDMQGNANPAALTTTMYGHKIDPGADYVLYGFGYVDYSITRFWVMTTGVGTATLHVSVVRS